MLRRGGNDRKEPETGDTEQEGRYGDTMLQESGSENKVSYGRQWSHEEQELLQAHKKNTSMS
eukprot:4054633-Pleurochrysis_carterae.AAC.1